jgi:hypothetical protein
MKPRTRASGRDCSSVRARVRTRPAPCGQRVLRAAHQPRPPPGQFYESATFTGAKEGYVFKVP